MNFAPLDFFLRNFGWILLVTPPSMLVYIVVYRHYKAKSDREKGIDYEELERQEKKNKDRDGYNKFFGSQGYTDASGRVHVEDASVNKAQAEASSTSFSNREDWVPEHLMKSINQVAPKRILAFVIDCFSSFLILVIAELILGKQLYQKTNFVWVILMFAYLPISEGLTGSTLGKVICKIKVVDAYGNKPGMKKAFIRGFLRLIELNPLLLAIPAMLSVRLSKTEQRVGDRLANTYVIESTANNS